jgi:hypothetical protein
VKQNEGTSTFASTGKIGEFASGFNGTIDEVRVYSAPLAASAIRERYLAGLNKLLAGGKITEGKYQENLLKLDQNYATNE